MNIPAMQGLIRRRLLLNYRVSPEAVSRVLPGNFRPKLVGGYAIAGVCLIRLEQVRPKGFPSLLGVSSENSAHRIAVEWEDGDGGHQEGVFVPRRDTGSILNSLAGGRIFPGVHHYSKFSVSDEDGEISIRVDAKESDDPLLEVDAMESVEFPEDSVFDSLDDSSSFFEAGCVGYSSRPKSCVLDGLLLKVDQWQVSALSVRRIKSSYFDDRTVFPEGEIAFDHALLMRDIPHEWHSEPRMEMKE